MSPEPRVFPPPLRPAQPMETSQAHFSPPPAAAREGAWHWDSPGSGEGGARANAGESWGRGGVCPGNPIWEAGVVPLTCICSGERWGVCAVSLGPVSAGERISFLLSFFPLKSFRSLAQHPQTASRSASVRAQLRAAAGASPQPMEELRLGHLSISASLLFPLNLLPDHHMSRTGSQLLSLPGRQTITKTPFWVIGLHSHRSSKKSGKGAFQ